MKQLTIKNFLKIFALSLFVVIAFNSCDKSNEPQPESIYGTVTDIDGNSYKTIKFLGKEWMIENLKTTRYNDGNSINLVEDSIVWLETDSAAYCWYGNNKEENEKYGALYNSYVVETKKLCPEGWKVPSEQEWENLISYQDSINVDSVFLNDRVFANLLGGSRSRKVSFYNYEKIGKEGNWWSSTPIAGDNYLFFNYAPTERFSNAGINKNNGFSVICAKPL
jgi:uncharacterized protein (TIGR02145 family)